MRGTILRATHHQRSISVNGMFSRGARWKHQPATGSNIADERCERAQRVWRKRGGGRPRKNGRGGGSPASKWRPRHLVPLGPKPRPADLSVMHVSLSKYLRKAAPTPPGLAPFLFAPVTIFGSDLHWATTRGGELQRVRRLPGLPADLQGGGAPPSRTSPRRYSSSCAPYPCSRRVLKAPHRSRAHTQYARSMATEL